MKILLWHVHGGWTDAFVRGPHQYLLPSTPDGGPWGLGRGGRDWPGNAVEIRPESIADQAPDVVVLQRLEEFDECERLLGRRPGRDIPAIFLEHNTPKGDVPNSRHPYADQHEIPVIHVTHFNQLMWDCGTAETTVIEHGIVDPGNLYTGERATLGVVVNEPIRRGRVTGTDLLTEFAQHSPLEVFGMGTGGLGIELELSPERLIERGDLPTGRLHAELAGCRAYIHPMRWTSLGLSLLEAMHLGLPVIALGMTEAYRAIPPEAGVVSNDVELLHRAATRLINDPDEARAMGNVARATALELYGLDAFIESWDKTLEKTVGRTRVFAVLERRTR